MNRKTFCRLFSLNVLCILSAAPVSAQSTFYEDKTITLIQGREPGDAGDMRVKAILPFVQKHLPGNPTIVSEYMPGGGGRKAANHIYRSVKPDGLTLGNLGAGFISNSLLGETGVQYDIDRFVYLGSPYSAAHYLFLPQRDLQLGSLEKLRAAPGIRIGAQSVGHTIYITGRLFSWLLDLKDPKFITAYAGNEIDVALMRGELDARAQAADWLLLRNRDWLDKRIMDFHAIFETPKGDKHRAICIRAGARNFCQTDKGAQSAGHAARLQTSRLAFHSPPWRAERADRNASGGDAQGVERSGICPGI